MPTEGELREVGEEIEIFFGDEWIRFDADIWLYAPEGATRRTTTPDNRLIFFVPGSGWEDVNGVSVSAPVIAPDADVAAVLAAVPDAVPSGTAAVTDQALLAYGDQPPTVAALTIIARDTAAIWNEPNWEPSARERADLQEISSGNLSAAAAVNAAINLVLSSILPETQARAMKSYVGTFRTITGRLPTEDELAQIGEHAASGATDAQIAARVRDLAQSLAPEAIAEAPEAPDRFAGVSEALEAERRLVEARRATDIAKKTRSAEEQFDAALDAGDLDKARLIRNFLDEPSEWQIELLKMEYADNLPALKVLFDYVDAIGRADVVPEDARALVEPTPPQPATPSERQKMVDPVGWAAAQPPGTFQTQGPPGFGGETPAFVGAEVFPETPAAALRRGDPDLFIPGGAQLGAEAAGDGTFRGPVGPVPSTRQLSATDMASPLFQSSLQTVTGTADEPVVHLLVDGIHTPLLASQYEAFVRQASSRGQTVEIPNRETGAFDTVTVGADGSIQARPTVEDDGSVRFGRTGERFVTEKRITPEEMARTTFRMGEERRPVSAAGPRAPQTFQGGVPPLAPFSLIQAEAGRPEGLPFTVTPETMDKIQSQQRIGLNPGEAHFVNPVTGQSGVMDFKTQEDIEEFKKQRPRWVEVARTDPLPVAKPTFGPSRAEREATFIKEAQAFAPQKKTPRPFGTPRFVTT